MKVAYLVLAVFPQYLHFKLLFQFINISKVYIQIQFDKKNDFANHN